MNNIKHLFFDENITLNSRNLIETEFEHCTKTLRLKVGSTFHITNGKGSVYKGIITEITKRNIQINILEQYNKERKNSRRLHLAVSSLKNKDRLDFIIEKATEIGVEAISIINCYRTINKITKIERLKKIAISGLKQSIQYHLPLIKGPISISEFIRQTNIQQSQILLAHCLERQNKLSIKQTQLQENITLMIGPEGDFTQSEIDNILINQNVCQISLGQTRLRTETAAIVAIFSIINS